ncbi:hypothetical protein BE08_26940 [Sorangium cellulosum]|uniref:Uncharacterized protein n=1 Tax=Sorangium cellulosum TaxID=56 RepID=A0A150PSW4_SORCE|nr:hypothetical protein BE08_26940 [Sorangium cellulosum]
MTDGVKPMGRPSISTSASRSPPRTRIEPVSGVSLAVTGTVACASTVSGCGAAWYPGRAK